MDALKTVEPSNRPGDADRKEFDARSHRGWYRRSEKRIPLCIQLKFASFTSLRVRVHGKHLRNFQIFFEVFKLFLPPKLNLYFCYCVPL